MKIIPSLYALVLALSLFLSPSAFAAVDVTAVDLQTSSKLLNPDGSSLDTLSGFSDFYYRSSTNISGGIAARYQALLLSDPWLSKGLPELQLTTVAYSSQDAADQAFEDFENSSRFNGEDLSFESSTSHALFYTREDGGGGVDLLQTVTTDSPSYHWLEKNGNVLVEASLYLGSGSVHQDTLDAFSSLELSPISSVLSNAVALEKVSLGLLFPPEDPFFTATTEASSWQLDSTYTLPANGSLSLDIYVSDPTAANGTVLDSSGLLSASDGDLYLYITKEGKLLAGLYAPYYDANCVQAAGWYSVSSSGTLYPYEWNHVTLRFGVGGFGLSLNGGEEAYCSVSQARSSRPLYMGDYPEDSVSEGMIGMVSNVDVNFSLDSAGRKVDSILTSQLFLDLSLDDEDFDLFKFLKEKKVFLGSDGMLKPDAVLNRAAMVKILLRAFGYPSSTESVSFSDVETNAWYAKYLAKAVEIGMIKGRDDGSFGGADPVTRAEFFTMLERLQGDFSGEASSFSDLEDEWYLEGAAYAEAMGFVSGEYFYPTQMVTRREAAQVLYELIQ